MARVIGKRELCSTDLKHFKSVQIIDGRTLIDRYHVLDNVVNGYIDSKYRHFLAQPERDGSSITWFAKMYKETPQCLFKLQGEDRRKYDKIKSDTIGYYKGIIISLRENEKDKAKAEYLEKAIAFVDDRVVYCYDGLVVLGVWGMQLRDDVRESTGIAVKDLFDAQKKPEPQSGIQPAPDNKRPREEDYVKEENSVPPPVSAPWYRRFGNWWKWLLWLLLLLLLLLLCWWLFRSCSASPSASYPAHDKPWTGNDPNTGGGGIYNPGNPYMPMPTPPKGGDILPPQQGVLPPIEDNPEIIPGNPTIIGNRLNILMENKDKSIMELAKDFKVKYPDDKYKVVYYDNVVKRMQIEIPSAERVTLKQEIPATFAPEYELFVFDEALFEGTYSPNDPAFGDTCKSWYLKAVNAPQAWNITRGSPKLTVAIVDNGFNLQHPELKDKVVMPYNVWKHSREIFPQKADHGTHVAGTALALADNKKGLCGIAPECAFMPVQVADAKGRMTTTSVLDGILYAVYQGADVINVSLGSQFASLSRHPEEAQRELMRNHFKEEERLWNEIMNIADKHNSTIVVAAGNDNVLAGIDPIQRPKHMVIVSAVNRQNQPYTKADFSNYGPYAAVSAPGVDIYNSIGKNGYAVMSGTSMAAPIVTGGIALMKSLNNTLTTGQIICILQNTGLATADNIGRLIQLDKALEMVKSGEVSACSDCDKIAEEIERLERRIERLKRICPVDTLKVKDISNPDSLNGKWKNAERLYNNKHEPVAVFYEFSGNTGVFTLVEENGLTCSAPLSLSVKNSALFIRQTGPTVCSDGKEYYRYVFKTYADGNGRIVCEVHNTIDKIIFLKFYLVRIN